MPKFMLILHHTPGCWDGMPEEEIQQVVRKYQAWLEGLKASGIYVSSDKLMEEGGKIVSQRNGRVSIVDGPYSESKEVIGGYFTLRAADYEAAVALARDAPFLGIGTIIVRQTDPMGCGDE